MPKDLVIRSKFLPQSTTPKSSVGRATQHSKQQMQKIAVLTAHVLEAQSDVTRYANFKAVTTVREAELLAALTNQFGSSPEARIALKRLTLKYLLAIEETTQLANDRFIAVLKHAASKEDPERFLDRLRALFS